jgi:hypothetical protein
VCPQDKLIAISNAYCSFKRMYSPPKNVLEQALTCGDVIFFCDFSFLKDDPRAQDKFAEINNAYEILSDQQKRQMYDQGAMDDKGNATGIPYVSIRQHTSVYVSIRQLRLCMSAYARCMTRARWTTRAMLQVYHTSAYVSICQHTSTYVCVCQHTPDV